MEGRNDLVHPLKWPKDSQPDDYYINERGMYEMIFGSQQPESRDFRKYCCNVLFPQIRQKVTNKLEKDHRQAIQAIQYENVGLQARGDVYQAQLQRYLD